MVPKKNKSKRVSVSRRNKNERNVREHNRKARKEARLNPTKTNKDPGIPNLWPHKDKLLKEIEESKRKAAEEKDRQRQQRQSVMMQNRDLAAMAADASARGDAFNATNATAVEWTPGVVQDGAATGTRDNSRKAYYREFRKVIDAADVILEVLDARDPIGCRPRKIEEMILNAGSQKRLILVLNKIDLVPREVVEQWLKYLRNELPTVAFKASTQTQRHHLGQVGVDVHAASDKALTGSECIGADNLMKLLKNYCRNANIKTAITVGVIGYPNVGKSSVINSMKRSRVCTVGSMPGMTKATQEISLDKNIKLLDCPGIVFSQEDQGAEAVLRNCIKVDLLEDPVVPVEVILSRCKPEQMMLMYQVPAYSNVNDFLVHVARQRGRLRKGGIPDLMAAAKCVLQDWNSGKIPYYTLPPVKTEQKVHLGAAVVASWSKEFEWTAEEDDVALQTIQSKADLKMPFLTMTSAEATVDLDAEIPEYSSDEMMEDDSDAPDATELSEDDDDDAMEEDAGEQEKPVFVTAGTESYKMPPMQKFKGGKGKLPDPVAQRQILTAEEKELNPQHGKSLKKDLKKRRKQAQKQQSIPDMDGDDAMDGDDTYDFSKFQPIPGNAWESDTEQ